MTTANPNAVEYARLTTHVSELTATIAGQGDQIATMQKTIADTATLLESIKEQVGPAIDALSSSPMFRALTGGIKS